MATRCFLFTDEEQHQRAQDTSPKDTQLLGGRAGLRTPGVWTQGKAHGIAFLTSGLEPSSRMVKWSREWWSHIRVCGRPVRLDRAPPSTPPGLTESRSKSLASSFLPVNAALHFCTFPSPLNSQGRLGTIKVIDRLVRNAVLAGPSSVSLSAPRPPAPNPISFPY